MHGAEGATGLSAHRQSRTLRRCQCRCRSRADGAARVCAHRRSQNLHRAAGTARVPRRPEHYEQLRQRRAPGRRIGRPAPRRRARPPPPPGPGLPRVPPRHRDPQQELLQRGQSDRQGQQPEVDLGHEQAAGERPVHLRPEAEDQPHVPPEAARARPQGGAVDQALAGVAREQRLALSDGGVDDAHQRDAALVAARRQPREHVVHQQHAAEHERLEAGVARDLRAPGEHQRVRDHP